MESKHDRVGDAHGKLPIINSIYDFSADALGQLRLWLEQNPPAVGISSIIGFSQFTAKTTGSILTSETTTSSSYVDLATVGPTLSGLSDGQYLVMYSAFAKNGGAGFLSVFSPSFNGATPTDDDQAGMSGTDGGYAMGFTTAVLGNGSNTITLQYKVTAGGGTGTFINRRLVALRYANK